MSNKNTKWNPKLIEDFYNSGEQKVPQKLVTQVNHVIGALDKGYLRVCERVGESWYTHTWIKAAILLYFRTQKMTKMQAGALQFFDKIPLKQWSKKEGVRVVPSALARKGSYVAPGCILMPSYINIGAYVDSGSMIDTWATVGSCAQIGKNVHLSGGVGIGGVLEPPQAQPVVIEDNAFIGSRAIIVEGIRVCERAVIAAGVTLTASTKIIDVTQKTETICTGVIPPDSVVIPGTQTKKFPAGTYGVPCALIIGKRKASTDLKTSLNQTLREYNISV